MKKILFILLILLLPSVASAATIGKVNANNIGLVGYWTFDGAMTSWGTNKTFDSSGLGNTGTLTGLPTSTTPTQGVAGQAFAFTSPSYVQLSSTTQTSINANLTVSVWVKPRSFNSGNGILSKGSQFGSAGQFHLQLQTHFNQPTNGRLLFTVGNGSVSASLASFFHVDLNTWILLTCTSDTITIRCYVNGIPQATADRSSVGTTFTGDSFFAIGTQNSNQAYFDGGIDDVRMYNRVLPATEVKALYNSGKAVVATSPAAASTTPLSNGLLGYWTFDSSKINWATGRVTDSSGSGNTGQFNGLATTTALAIGKVGQAINFDRSVTQTVTFPTIVSGTTFTYAAWVKANEPLFNAFGSIFMQADGQAGFFYNKGSHKFQFFYSSVTHANNTTLNNNAWYHYVASVNNGVATYYLNGVPDGSSTAVPSTNFAMMGDEGNGDRFKGMLDDVRFYNRALSANEVSQLYNSGSAKVGRSGAVAGTTTAPLSNGLVGYWTLDGSKTNWATGSTSDSSGNRNTGQLVSMSTTSSPAIGKVGQTLRFLGNNTHVKIPYNAAATPLGTDKITLSAWFRIDGDNSCSSNQGGHSLIDLGGDQVGIFYFYSSRSVSMHVRNGGFNSTSAVTTFLDKTWHHLAGVYNGTDVRLYIDGVLVNTPLPLTGNITNDSGATVLGGVVDGNNSALNGALDDARVYNRALSANEVKQLYNATK